MRGLLARLALLVAQRRFRFAYLRRQAGGVLRVVGRVRPQLVRGEGREELALLHDVALADQELADLAGHLGTDDDVVGGDDAGEGERLRAHARVGVGTGDGDDDQGEQDSKALHDGLKQMYKTNV